MNHRRGSAMLEFALLIPLIIFVLGATVSFGLFFFQSNVKKHGKYQINYLLYTVSVERKTTYYVMFFVVPAVMTSYMNTLVFVMPATCGERISFLVSVFVSEAVFVSFCTNQMPQGNLEH